MEHGIVSAPSPVPGRYLALAENGLGAGSLDHLMRNVFFASDALADHGAEDPFRELEAALASSPPGARGMLFLPWLTGAVAPESEASMRGGFLNISLETGRADMVRAVTEGIAYGLRWLLPAVEEFVGHEFSSLRFAGGAAVSEGWARIMADATGRPVQQLADARHVINRASAYLTFCDRGEADRSQLETFCPVKRAYEPEAVAVYDRLFEQFVRTFEQTRPIFQALNG
jgi:xylulokinase